MKPILAIDIDDTLSDTTEYFAQLLNERFGNPENVTPKEIIKKYKIIPNVPYWQTAEILAWREEQSFSNEAQKALPPIAGSVEAVQKLFKHFDILYISSRPSVVVKGTSEWLQEQGFPSGELVLRTTYDKQNGNAWKADIIEQKWPQVVGVVDDNPEIIWFFSRHYKGVIYLFGVSARSEMKDRNVRLCARWEDVLHEINKDQIKSS
jgi:5'(3')-deoxyribonucleotidase